MCLFFSRLEIQLAGARFDPCLIVLMGEMYCYIIGNSNLCRRIESLWWD
jgi:hypothetical protein